MTERWRVVGHAGDYEEEGQALAAAWEVTPPGQNRPKVESFTPKAPPAPRRDPYGRYPRPVGQPRIITAETTTTPYLFERDQMGILALLAKQMYGEAYVAGLTFAPESIELELYDEIEREGGIRVVASVKAEPIY